MSERYLDAAEAAGPRLLFGLGDARPSASELEPLLALPHLAGLVVGPDTAVGVVDTAHAAGRAVFILDDAETARTAEADGVLLVRDRDRVAEGRMLLGADALIGVACGASRHDAMLAGERGCDYVVFAGAADALIEIVAWWAGLFELPCVADLRGGGDPAALADAGADFLLLDDFERLRAADAALGTMR